jgi:hypothetical protein
MQDKTMDKPATFGLIGFFLGVLSIVIILIQLSAFFEPQAKSSGTTIGEIAAEIKLSAARAFAGEPAPEPTPIPKDGRELITIAALCVAGIAVGLGAVGLYRKEPHQLSYLAVGIGMSAFVMQFVFWMAILMCGFVLLVSIVKNIDSIFE